MLESLLNILSVIGGCFTVYFVVYKVFPILYWCYAFFIRRGKNLREYGEWALVTGATDGIGKAYCFELAACGLNVLVISRSPAKCEAVEKELQDQYPKLQFRHLVIDFGNFDAQRRELVQRTVDGMDIGVLINNVGKGVGGEYLYEASDETMNSMVDINIHSLLWMMKIVLGDEEQGMVSRKRGAIVNIGSLAGYVTQPLGSMYGAAKKYIIMLSKSLHAELADHGIHVSVQNPGRVVTNMIKDLGFTETSLFAPSAETWVKSAIRCIGYESCTFGYWAHGLTQWQFELSQGPSWDKGNTENEKRIRQERLDARNAAA